jgi:hypothetical protein
MCQQFMTSKIACALLVSVTGAFLSIQLGSQIVDRLKNASIDLSVSTVPHETQRCEIRRRMHHDANFMSNIEWVRETSIPNRWRLKIARCSLDITRDKARVCLTRAAPRGVMLIGDSVTRYQYLNLVYFLETGEWYSPNPRNSNEKEFGSWHAFHKITNARLGGRELCDCFRKENRSGQISESRMYQDRELSVTYVQMFNPPIIRMHGLEYIRRCSPFCPPNESFAEVFDASQSPDRLVDLAGSHSISLINMGHWYKKSGGASRVVSARFVSVLSRAENIHWKTTTFPGNRESEFASKFKGVFDAYALTTALPTNATHSLMWDRLHFTEDVYRGLNEALLSYICEDRY